ncbi:MAG: class I SAM-dependent methyltransferase [Acidimicrobiia bacterium]
MTTNDVAARRDALADRLFGATIGALELFGVHLGIRLGLYRWLAVSGPMTAGELSTVAGIDERYGREWLEQQAVAGFLDVEDPAAPGAERRYSLPAGHDAVLADPEDAAYAAPFAPMVVGIAGALPAVVEAYRMGTGVPYARYGTDFCDGQAAINRPAFTHDLAAWLAAAPDLDARLRAEPPARIADLGCGQGWSTLALAAAYPKAAIDGIDLDEASIRAAESHAAGHAAGTRVTFSVRDAGRLAESGPYELVCIFEALHDMSAPVEVLASARAALTPDGAVLVADERVADAFTAPGDEVERMMYGWSISHCLPASRESQPSAALGTVLRQGTVRELATAAAFSSVDVLPVDNLFFRFYVLRG